MVQFCVYLHTLPKMEIYFSLLLFFKSVFEDFEYFDFVYLLPSFVTQSVAYSSGKRK